MAKAETFKLLSEAQLNSELKAGKLRRIYYFYGEEAYLTRVYAERIESLSGANGGDGLNMLKLRGSPDMNTLSDFAESMPFFAEYKCVRITDLDAEALDAEQTKQLLSLIGQLPETAIIIISQTGLEIDDKKPKAKTKKLIQAVEGAGAVCRFSFLPPEKAAGMAAKKAAKSGCALSAENARYLTDMCGGSLTLIQNEVEKLCVFKGQGEITRQDIDALTPRMIDADVYALSDCILERRAGQAVRILDGLFERREEPVMILAALSGAFVDYYRAKLAIKAGKSPQAAAKDFLYFGGRAYYFGRTFNAARRVSEDFIKHCLEILFRTNCLLNSSRADKKMLLEKAALEMINA